MSYEDFRNEQTEKLNSIFDALDAGEFDKDEIKSKITGVLEEQAKYGKQQYDKKQTQIKKYEDVLDAIGYDQAKYENVKDFADTFKQEKETIDSTKSEKDQLLERIKRLEAEDAERKAKADKLARENEVNTITNKLNESIGGKLKGAKYIIKDLINTGKVKMVDGEVMFVDGDDVVLFDKGIDNVLHENEDLIINSQNAGVGTTKTKKENDSKSGLTLDDINKMSPEELKSNMSEIKKLAGMR